MNILAIETATEACSAALLLSDDADNNAGKNNKNTRLISRFQLAPREHTKLILPMLEEVLEEAQIKLDEVDAIAFGRGPGAFTGLRIAAGVAQGVALSVDKPVVPVSTLAALALQATEQTEFTKDKIIFAGLDARMGEIYWGKFKFANGTVEQIGEEQVSKLEDIQSNINQHSIDKQPIIAIGSGWTIPDNQLPESNQVTIIKACFPAAEYIARLALPLLKANRTVVAEDAQPVYIRNNVAEKSKKQKT